MICFYHRGDLDGHCSGAIVRHRFPECRMMGIDYEDKFPWNVIERGEDVVMVDFSLPMDQMKNIRRLCTRPHIFWPGGRPPHDFIWIDHHKTAIDAAREAGFEAPGLLRVGDAACELAWEYFFPNESMPYAVRLLGRYDVWDESWPTWEKDVLPLQYGLRCHPTSPDNPQTKELWFKLFDLHERISPNGGCSLFIQEGKVILRYQHQQDAKLMARHSFYTRLDDMAALAVNHGPGSSMKFENGHHEDFPLLISFARIPKKKWLVNLYTFREDVDVGEIAKRYGGGGHRKAAGFICENLPFEI